MGVPVIQSIDLLDFAVVGECGNVNSSDIHLGSEDMSKLKDLLSKLHVEEEKEEENIEISEPEEAEEEVAEPEYADVHEELEVSEPEQEEEEDVAEMFELLLNQVSDLKAENATLRGEIEKLNATMEKIKSLKVSIGTAGEAEKPVSEKRYSGRDGIGEI